MNSDWALLTRVPLLNPGAAAELTPEGSEVICTVTLGPLGISFPDSALPEFIFTVQWFRRMTSFAT